VAACTALGAIAGIARADEVGPTRAECMQAYESSQLERQSQHLIEARQHLRVCASERCPALARTDCVSWLSDINSSVPSVVFDARADDEAVFDVRVLVDGIVVATALDGRPTEIDPGLHTLTFEHAGKPPLEQKVIIREGETSRRVLAEWSPPRVAAPVPAAVATRTVRPVPTAAFVLAGVGVAGVADFVVAALLGNAKKNELQASGCAPFCSSNQVGEIKTRYAIADVGLAVAAAATVATGIVFATRPERPSAVSIHVTPSTSGALVGLHGGF
jgi:hypothetical protein